MNNYVRDISGVFQYDKTGIVKRTLKRPQQEAFGTLRSPT